MMLNGEQTDNFIKEAIMAHQLHVLKFDRRDTKPDDPYPWLDDDNERKHLSDKEILEKYIH